MENDPSTGSVFVGMLFYVAALVLIGYILLKPTLDAKKKYGKDEFRFFGKFKFIGGINLPQNVQCKVFCLRSRVIFESSGQEFSLATSKIIDVSIMTNSQIQKQYVSSIGGAVAGAVLLGPIGAIIGGSASKRTITNKTKYLIFTYKESTNSTDAKYIVLDVNGKVSNANKFKKEFSHLKKADSVKIEL